MLDSFGSQTYADGSAGAIYGQYPPLVNASREPGQWQIYEVIYTAPRFDSEGAEQRPEQPDGAEKKGAMKERFEIELDERRKDSVSGEDVGGPKKDRRCQRAEKNRSGEIGEQSGCVFQAANVRFGPDAQSTHMDGEKRRGPEARSARDEVRRQLAAPVEVCG